MGLGMESRVWRHPWKNRCDLKQSRGSARALLAGVLGCIKELAVWELKSQTRLCFNVGIPPTTVRRATLTNGCSILFGALYLATRSRL